MQGQQELGTTGWETTGMSLKWTWERGWEGRIYGRRSASSKWLEADLGPAVAEAFALQVGAILERRGEEIAPDPFSFSSFQIVGQVQQKTDFVRRIVFQCQKASPLQIYRHTISPLNYWIASRTSGMDMQRGPPRPRDSSLESISCSLIPYRSNRSFV